MARRPVSRAADVESGAMVALVPSEKDAARLAVDGGEPVEQLHCTLVYLGDGVDYPPYVRELLYGLVGYEAAQLQPITADGFSVSLFNPGEEPCVVLGLSGGDLGQVHDTVTAAVTEALGLVDVVLPDQHEPWLPHVTIAYGDDPAVVKQVASKTGPVTFDRIRLAFADDVIDVPLGSPVERADWTATETAGDEDDLDEDTLALLEALSRFDSDPSRAGWDPAKHPRIPAGKPGGGRFLTIADRIEAAIKNHHEGHGTDPFEGFSREQLRKAAKAKGIDLKRGAGRDEIAKALRDHVGNKAGGRKASTAVEYVDSPVKKVRKPTPGRVATKPREFKSVDEMESWGDKHFEHDGLTRAQQQAVTYYSHAGDRDMNGILRGPAGRTGPPLPAYLQDEARAHIRELDSVMAPVPEDVKAYRATSIEAFQGVEPRAGMVFTDPGFMSTTLDSTFLETVTPGVEMRISVPKGAPAYYLDGLSRHEDERELLLGRGAQLRFTRVHKPEDPDSGEQWVIDAEVVLPDGQ